MGTMMLLIGCETKKLVIPLKFMLDIAIVRPRVSDLSLRTV
jgi:hypothetical protein